jgi:FxsC-like protein
MNSTSGVRDRVGLGSSYFFLSYAHSPPLAGTNYLDSDQWVHQFFDDLAGRVTRLTTKSGRTAGYFDQKMSLLPGWKASINRAISGAEVFVPLLSPGYYTRSWPGREWASFEQRLINAGLNQSEVDQRFEPVLWIPMPAEPARPRLEQALALGSGVSPYVENGLRALLRLAAYRDSYLAIVDRLAARIVQTVEDDQLQPSWAPGLDETVSPFSPPPGTAIFEVIVAAPVSTELPPGLATDGYGAHDLDWRAYPREQELPLAQYAAQIAEQLDFTVHIRGINSVAKPSGDHPAVILIDPWLATNEAGWQALTALTSKLPSWVLPVLVLTGKDQDKYGRLIQQVRTALHKPQSQADPAWKAYDGIDSLSEFVKLMPILVTEAERRYRRREPDSPTSPQPRFWPRLTATPTAPRHQEGNNA